MFSDLGRQAMDYIHDAQQRSILYLDAMRQSGDQYVEHVSQGKPLDKPYKLPDGTGLYLLVNKSGKYWRYDYRFEGKRKTIAYGVYPVVEFLKAVSLRRPFLCSLLIRHRGDILRDYAWAISMV